MFHRPVFYLAIALLCLRQASSAQAEVDQGTLAAIAEGFATGTAAFEKSDWAAAMAEMEKVIAIADAYPDQEAMAAAREKLAPVYYTIGAAAFNVPDYPKTMAAFQNFIKIFPRHEKVPEAKLAIARAAYLNKDYQTALDLFVVLEQYPSIRDQALAVEIQCLKELGKPKEMAEAVAKLTSGGITSVARAGGALMLAQAWLDSGAWDKLEPLLDELVAQRQFVENIVALNPLIVALGDHQADQQQYDKASRTYAKVMGPGEVIAFQKVRIKQLERKIAARGSQSAPGQLAELEASLQQARMLLTEFEKLPDYMPALMLRNSRCWYGQGKKWEAILVNERLAARYPNAKTEKEAALFNIVICYADLLQVKSCQDACALYLQQFPTGPNAGTVTYVQGAVALQSGDVKGAATLFGSVIETQSDNKFIDQIYLMLAGAHWNLGELDEAWRTYKKYIEKFPNGPSIEEVKYRAAILPVFQGKYEDGWKGIEAFLKEYPQSQFASDAKYRLMVCKFAANYYDDVLEDVAKWEKAHAGDLMEPEVLTLKGDCLAANGKDLEAAIVYQAAGEGAATEEVLNYAYSEASRLFQKLGEWDRLSSMWEEFIDAKPDHSGVVMGIFWIGKAKGRQGKVDEAKEITVAHLKRCLNDPKNESVEMLLQQLVQLCWKRPRPPVAPASESSAPVASTASVEPASPAPELPVLPPWDPMAELNSKLAPLVPLANETGKARLRFVRSELLKMQKKPEEAFALMEEIALQTPDTLSPQLLALVGDHLQAKKFNEQAESYYVYLRDHYLKSGWLDYAYVGLGDLALTSGNARKALEYYTAATEEYTGGKIKEATMGRAIALLETGQEEEARKLFETVAGTREWRGEITAQAVYYLGQVEERRNRLPEAIAFYERVMVAYQKYIPWVEKSSIKAAQCLDRIGKRPEAVTHLKEVVANEKLGFEAKNQARTLLRQWGEEA